MKAVLVLDEMPKTCADCPVCAWSEITGLYNCLNGTKDEKCVDDYLLDDRLNKPSWCPLKPLPPYLETPYLFRQEQIANGLQNEDGSVPVYSEDYMNGWNDCLETLLGEEE